MWSHEQNAPTFTPCFWAYVYRSHSSHSPHVGHTGTIASPLHTPRTSYAMRASTCTGTAGGAGAASTAAPLNYKPQRPTRRARGRPESAETASPGRHSTGAETTSPRVHCSRLAQDPPGNVVVGKSSFLLIQPQRELRLRPRPTDETSHGRARGESARPEDENPGGPKLWRGRRTCAHARRASAQEKARAGGPERRAPSCRPALAPGAPRPGSVRRRRRTEGRGERLAAPAQSGGFSREDGRHYRISPTNTTRIPQPTR